MGDFFLPYTPYVVIKSGAPDRWAQAKNLVKWTLVSLALGGLIGLYGVVDVLSRMPRSKVEKIANDFETVLLPAAKSWLARPVSAPIPGKPVNGPG